MHDSAITLLGINQSITNWLTPVWLLSLGAGIGLALVMVVLLKVYLFSKIPFVNKVGESLPLRLVFGILIAAAYVAMFILFYWWRYGIDTDNSGSFSNEELNALTMPLVFVVPLALLIGIGVWSLFTKRGADETFALLSEGFLSWVSVICVSMSIFACTGIGLGLTNGFGLIKFVDDVPGMVNSLKRFPFSGVYGPELTVPPTPIGEPGTKVPANIIGEEVTWVGVKTDQAIEIASEPITVDLQQYQVHELDSLGGEEFRYWLRRAGARGWIPDGSVSDFYISNRGDTPANVSLQWRLDPVYRQIWLVPWTASTVVGLYLIYLVLAVNFPKVAAISLSTFKTEVSQPLFWLILIVGCLFLIGSVYIPYNTFGEDIKMYKDAGLTLIKVLAIFMAIWAASKSVAEEIEGRTALTVLSKPVGRRQFIFGKFFGISLSAAILFLLLGICFVVWIAYKPLYDGVESSKGLIDWDICFLESIHIIPALLLAFLEVVIFVAISVAISTRVGILANFIICFAIYTLGHLTPLIVQSSDVVEAFESVVVFANVIAIIFPVLNHFDVQAAINNNTPVEMLYLGWATIYCALYSSIALLIALVLFEDRDLT